MTSRPPNDVSSRRAVRASWRTWSTLVQPHPDGRLPCRWPSSTTVRGLSRPRSTNRTLSVPPARQTGSLQAPAVAVSTQQTNVRPVTDSSVVCRQGQSSLVCTSSSYSRSASSLTSFKSKLNYSYTDTHLFNTTFNWLDINSFWTLNEHFYSTLSQTMARPRQTRGQICTIWAPKTSNKNTTYMHN